MAHIGRVSPREDEIGKYINQLDYFTDKVVHNAVSWTVYKGQYDPPSSSSSPSSRTLCPCHTCVFGWCGGCLLQAARCGAAAACLDAGRHVWGREGACVHLSSIHSGFAYLLDGRERRMTLDLSIPSICSTISPVAMAFLFSPLILAAGILRAVIASAGTGGAGGLLEPRFSPLSKEHPAVIF